MENAQTISQSSAYPHLKGLRGARTRYKGHPNKALLRTSTGLGLVAGYKWARDHADYEALRCMLGRDPDCLGMSGLGSLDAARRFISMYRECSPSDVSDGEIYDFFGALGLDEYVCELTEREFWRGFMEGADEWFDYWFQSHASRWV